MRRRERGWLECSRVRGRKRARCGVVGRFDHKRELDEEGIN